MFKGHNLLDQVPKSFDKKHFILDCYECNSKTYVHFDPNVVSGERFPYICPFCGCDCTEVSDMTMLVNEYLDGV